MLALLPVLAAGSSNAPADSRARVIESIVPWLAFNSSCSSVVLVQNLGSRQVAAEVEAHKSSGALTPLAGRSGIEVRLAPGERGEY